MASKLMTLMAVPALVTSVFKSEELPSQVLLGVREWPWWVQCAALTSVATGFRCRSWGRQRCHFRAIAATGILRMTLR